MDSILSCTRSKNCRIRTCLTAVAGNCNTCSVAGLKAMQIASISAVMSVTYDTDDTNCPEKYISTYTMATKANAGDQDGCDTHLFYQVCPRKDTLNVQFETVYNPATGTCTNTATITGILDLTDCAIACALDDYTKKEMVVRYCENGTGQWWDLGHTGGLYWTRNLWNWGTVKATDSKEISFTIEGNPDESPKCILDTDETLTLDMLVATSALCSTADTACPDESGG